MAYDLMEELRHECMQDQIGEMQREAKEAFMNDSYMREVADENGMTMEDLWEQEKNDYTNEYFA